nr:hypothetical protein [Tanacetum cinerariifolium]
MIRPTILLMEGMVMMSPSMMIMMMMILTEDPEEEPFEEDNEEEKEHLAPVDSSAVPIVDLVLSARETEALEADEPSHAPVSPISIPFYQTCLPVVSDASSAITYTSVYTDSEPWRYYREDSVETGPPGVIVYGYVGLPIQAVASPSPNYVPEPEHPPSPDYVPGPEHPPSPMEIPYVPEPEYPEYLAPSDDELPLENQLLPTDASPIAASPDYVADSDLEEDPEKDPEDDQADYPTDGGDGDDEPFNDDNDDDDTD